MKTLLTSLLLLIFLIPAQAQPGPYRTGLGIQLGEPSGITLKIYQSPRNALDFAASWDFDSEFLFFQGHYLWEQALAATSPNVRFFYGPGLFVGMREHRGEDDVAFGGSANIGLGLWVERFEFFLQVTPRIEVIPATDADVGAGLGVRFYF